MEFEIEFALREEMNVETWSGAAGNDLPARVRGMFDEKTSDGAGAVATATPDTQIVYAEGFYDLERAQAVGGAGWSLWSEYVSRTGKEMRLKVAGNVPTDRFRSLEDEDRAQWRDFGRVLRADR
jgi:hypothetical protein